MSGRDRNINQITVLADYSVPIDMDYVFVDATVGDIVVTLKRTLDRLIRIHKVQKVDAGANTVTVTDGTLSYVLANQGQAAIFEIDAEGNFHVFGASESGGGAGGFSLEIPTGDVDGVNDEFVFTSPPIFVTYQGVIQTLTVDYTLVGSTVTFGVPPTGIAGDVQGLVSA